MKSLICLSILLAAGIATADVETEPKPLDVQLLNVALQCPAELQKLADSKDTVLTAHEVYTKIPQGNEKVMIIETGSRIFGHGDRVFHKLVIDAIAYTDKQRSAPSAPTVWDVQCNFNDANVQ